MKTATRIFILLTYIGISCSEPDNQIAGENLYETNHSLGFSRLQYYYLNNRVDHIMFLSDNAEYVYLKVNYQSSEGNKIASVIYSPDNETLQQKDTIIYEDDHLIRIIKTTKQNEVVTRRDTTNFVYDQLGNLIQASNTVYNKRVDFQDYKDKVFSRCKTYRNSQLFFDVSLKYDERQSPFKKLYDLNLVIFNMNELEGLEYLTDNNIIQMVEKEYQSTVFTNTSIYKYSYDSKNRPIKSITTREGDNEFKIEEFYHFK